jgi:hypothetical protein
VVVVIVAVEETSVVVVIVVVANFMFESINDLCSFTILSFFDTIYNVSGRMISEE